MHISENAIRRPVTVIVLTAALLVLGGVSFTRLKLDFLPQVDFPFVGVQVPYPNAVPAQVERDITRPIEEILSTLGGVKETFSYSSADGAFVGVEFEFGRNIDVLRMEVKERMEKVRPLLPADILPYDIFTFNSNDIPILVGRISSRGTDLSNSYDLLERRVINPISRVEGVGRVVVDGIAPKDVTIYLLLDQILAHSVDVSRLFQLLERNNIDLTLGDVRNGQNRMAVRALGQIRSIDELEVMQVNDAGVRLSDVAEIVYAEPVPNYYRRINGESAIAFEIQKASGANIVDVSRRVEHVLEDIRQDPALAGVDVVLFFDQADEITASLKGLLQSGLFGSLLAIAILLVFLRNFRSTAVVGAAIPISVVGACVYLFLANRTLNVLTMMGLMLAVGMLVDNAIVVLESIHRRQEKGEAPRSAAERGSREVAVAVTASTLTSVIVFAPIVFGKGNELVVWLSEVGITISVTLVFSLLACLTLVPLLAARMGKIGTHREFGFLTRLRNGYLRTLGWTLRHPKKTAFLFVPLALLITVGAVKVSGFGPDDSGDKGIKQDNLYLRLEFPDNANVTRVRQYVDEIEPFLLAKRDTLGIESVYTFYQSNYAAMGLFFEDGTEVSEERIRDLRSWLRENMPTVAGVKYNFGRDDQNQGPGAKQLAVTLFGEDSDLLAEIGAEVQRRLALLPELKDVETDLADGGDEIRVRIDPARAGRFGVRSQNIAEILGLTFRGVPLKKIQSADREIDLGIVLEPSDRRSVEQLAEMPVHFEDGRSVRLGQIASFEFAKGPDTIQRRQQQASLTVRGAYEGEEFDEVVDQARALMSAVQLPAGYSWSFGREMQRTQEQQGQMGTNVLLALFCVYLVMAALFESFLHPLVIMFCVPFALLGVVWTLLLTGTPLNILAMIGVIILIGVVVNNGIVLLDHVNGLRRAGLSRDEAIREGCRDRFRPILMTASTTVLGLVPLAFGTAAIGDGYYYPLARAVMGGLTASTVLTLLLLPTFYVLAEDGVARLRQTIRWGMGRAPLPWRAVESGTVAPTYTRGQ
ncbi:MAG: efflux RND transporter permease subunit [Candidatus Eisenbacteria bacterium]|nr:efflux RND transporter permease subunit [Candidatus Eisenbacteria bacterium]